MAELESDSTYRISGLFITPNWNGNSDRVAMSCGLGAYIKVLRKVSIDGETVIIAADTAGTMARSWNMTARNTILRTTAKVYLYARVERNGSNGMYIWSPNIYNIDGTIPSSVPDASASGATAAVNNDLYYYIRVGSLETNRTEYEIDKGQYGIEWGDDSREDVGYDWSDLIAWDRGRDLLVFLKTIAGLAITSIVLAGHELSRVLTSNDDENSEYASSDNAVVTGGFLNRWVNKIKGMFIRKDVADGTDHPLHAGEIIAKRTAEEGSNGIVRTERFTATSGAMDGVGAGMWMLEDGTGIMETDLFYVRRAAYFRTLTIAEVKHMGGEVILSAAACQIAYVVPHDANGTPIPSAPSIPGELDSPTSTTSFYRCYFEKQANGRKVYNEWMNGDQPRCKRFDANGNEVEGSFYWRLVVNVGEDEDFYYVDLSATDCAAGSNPPKSNDNIVLFGHRNPINHDRTCAQMYSTVGIHAPSRAYYAGITSYDLSQAQRPEYLERDARGNIEWQVGDGTHYIKYNTRGGLDIRTSSMTVIADGNKDINVADALGDNFNFYTTDDTAPTVNGGIAEWINEDGINPSRDEWTEAEYPSHVGDYLITADGFTYEFVYDTTKGYGWKISSDQYLIHAQENADKAVKNLDDMASDNVITRQEKQQVILNIESFENERTSIIEEAAKADVEYDAYNESFLRLRAFYSYFQETSNADTELSNADGTLVVVKMLTTYVVQRRMDIGQDFKSTYIDYYYSLSELRKEITFAVKDAAVTFEQGIDQAIKDRLDKIETKYAGYEGSISDLNSKYNLIAQQGGGSISGLLSESNFSTIFAKHGDLYASIATYVTEEISGISLTADKIDFSAFESVTIFSQNFRISSKELSIYYDEASKKEVIIIDTDNFKLDRSGNAYLSGEVHATSGSFDGTLTARKFVNSYGVLDLKNKPVADTISTDDPVNMVFFELRGKMVVQLPPNPTDGQVVKIFANCQETRTFLGVSSGRYNIVTANHPHPSNRKPEDVPDGENLTGAKAFIQAGTSSEFMFLNNSWYQM